MNVSACKQYGCRVSLNDSVSFLVHAGKSWLWFCFGTIPRRRITNTIQLSRKCKQTISENLALMCPHSLQIDLKGVPMFIMSKILRAHPVCAIQALRKHFNTTRSHQSPWLFSSFNFRRRSRAHSLSTSTNNREDSLPVTHFLNEDDQKA